MQLTLVDILPTMFVYSKEHVDSLEESSNEYYV